MDMGDTEEAVAAPGIVGEAHQDLIGMIGANDEEDIGCAFDWATEEDEAVVDKGVHEVGVRLPEVLLFERAGRIPLPAVGARDCEQLRHSQLPGEKNLAKRKSEKSRQECPWRYSNLRLRGRMERVGGGGAEHELLLRIKITD